MADIAAVFHWPQRDMEAMELHELMDWQERAIDRFAQMERVREKTGHGNR